jgi:hypothetical protein
LFPLLPSVQILFCSFCSDRGHGYRKDDMMVVTFEGTLAAVAQRLNPRLPQPSTLLIPMLSETVA